MYRNLGDAERRAVHSMRGAARRLVWLPPLTASVLATDCAPEQGQQRRVVLISLDTLRYDGFAADQDAASQPPSFTTTSRPSRYVGHGT